MLPQLPQVFGPAIDQEITAAFSHREADEPGTRPVEHHCQVCPTCGHTLTAHHCKLVCTYCGYYMSCADYY